MATALNLASFQRPAAVATPTLKTEVKPVWHSLDTATLSPDIQRAYFTYKQEQDKANTARKAFETLMRAKVELDDHLDLAFGYRFGQLSIAMVPRERKSGARAAMSMEQFMATV